jgi:hypothetical protein
VTDASGNGMEGVRIEGGFTHWTFTDAEGRYTLRSLIDGPRTLTASKSGVTFASDKIEITMAGKDVEGIDFRAVPGSR